METIVDTEKIKILSGGVSRLEEKARFKRDEIIKWRKDMPDAKKLFKVATILGVDVNELLITYDPQDENTIVLRRAQNMEWWYGIYAPEKKDIYSVMCKATNRRYIGSSANADERIKNHIIPLTKGRHCNTEMQKDFNKYGLESFECKRLGTFDWFIGNHMEYFFSYYYETKDIRHGYNYKDKHGSASEKLYREDIAMLQKRADARSITMEELLTQSRIILKTVDAPYKYVRKDRIRT